MKLQYFLYCPVTKKLNIRKSLGKWKRNKLRKRKLHGFYLTVRKFSTKKGIWLIAVESNFIIASCVWTVESCKNTLIKTIITFTYFNLLSANPTKWSNTLKQLVGNLPTTCLSMFDNFVKLALKRLINISCLTTEEINFALQV